MAYTNPYTGQDPYNQQSTAVKITPVASKPVSVTKTLSAQELANKAKGLTNLQQYSWWRNNPNKNKAWSILNESKATVVAPNKKVLPDIVTGYNAIDDIANKITNSGELNKLAETAMKFKPIQEFTKTAGKILEPITKPLETISKPFAKAGVTIADVMGNGYNTVLDDIKQKETQQKFEEPFPIARQEQQFYQQIGFPEGEEQLSRQVMQDTLSGIGRYTAEPAMKALTVLYQSPLAAKEFLTTFDVGKSLRKLIPQGYEFLGIESGFEEGDIQDANAFAFASMQMPSIIQGVKQFAQGSKLYLNELKVIDNAIDTLKIKPFAISKNGGNIINEAKRAIVGITEAGQTQQGAINALKTIQDNPLLSRIVAVSRRYRIDPAKVYEGIAQDLSMLALPAPKETIANTINNSLSQFFNNPIKYLASGTKKGSIRLDRVLPFATQIDDFLQKGINFAPKGTTQLMPSGEKLSMTDVGVTLPDTTSILRGTKGMTANDIMATYPNIQLKKDVPATDIYGNKRVIPEGEKLTPYELKGNKILLQDGETYIVSKNQFQNIKGNTVGGEAKPFAPELQGLEETVKEGISSPAEGVRQFGGGSTKYSQYTLPNGENYREVLIKAPEMQGRVPKDISFEEWNKNRASWGKPAGTMEEYNKGNPVSQFKSSHWEEPNVIAHLRLNDRTYNGKKVTFMEELQCDWAREGRDKGFAKGNLQELDAKRLEIENKGKSATPSEKAEWAKIMNEITVEKKGLQNNPHLKNWQELSIKRALKDAVDNGSDYFAWINGEQTSARYNLATHLDGVDWGGSNLSNRKIVDLKPKGGGNEMRLEITPEGNIYKTEGTGIKDWEGKKLDEVLGKGLSDKIMAKEEGTLSGEGLKFGGEWANNLYDKQVKDIVQKLTGQKVEMLDMGLLIETKGKNTWNIATVDTVTKTLLTKDNIKVGEQIASEDRQRYIITEILGDGKFKAMKKTDYEDMISGKDQFTKYHPEQFTETFDISQKTTQQQGIKLTPEVKAKIRGEAIPIETSGKMFEDKPITQQPSQFAYATGGYKPVPSAGDISEQARMKVEMRDADMPAQPKYNAGDNVSVNIGHKIVSGKVTKYDGGKYITVKHDNFAGEVFSIEQVSPKETVTEEITQDSDSGMTDTRSEMDKAKDIILKSETVDVEKTKDVIDTQAGGTRAITANYQKFNSENPQLLRDVIEYTGARSLAKLQEALQSPTENKIQIRFKQFFDLKTQKKGGIDIQEVIKERTQDVNFEGMSDDQLLEQRNTTNDLSLFRSIDTELTNRGYWEKKQAQDNAQVEQDLKKIEDGKTEYVADTVKMFIKKPIEQGDIYEIGKQVGVGNAYLKRLQDRIAKTKDNTELVNLAIDLSSKLDDLNTEYAKRKVELYRKGEEALRDIMDDTQKELPIDVERILNLYADGAKEAKGLYKAIPELAPIRQLNPETQNVFITNDRQKALIEEYAKDWAMNVNIPIEKKGNFEHILAYEKGEFTPHAGELKNIFDAAYSLANQIGHDVDYRQNYIFHIWESKGMEDAIIKYLTKEKPDEAREYVFKDKKGSLKLRPSFDKSRVFPTYADGIKYGATPKHKTVQEIVYSYIKQAFTAKVNEQMISRLKALGEMSKEKTDIATDRITVPQFDDYYASPEVAKLINNEFKPEDKYTTAEKFFGWSAKVNSAWQEWTLSGGARSINAFTGGQILKNAAKRLGQGDILGVRKEIYDAVRATSNKYTRKYFEDHKESIIKLIEGGVDLSRRNNPFDAIQKQMKRSGKLWQTAKDYFGMAFNEAAFANHVPLETIRLYEEMNSELLKKGYSESDANKYAIENVKNYLGLSDNLHRSRMMQNIINTFFFAPRFREGVINAVTRTLSAINPKYYKDPSYKNNRALLKGIIATFVVYQIASYFMNGKATWENEPGRELDLKIPLPDGNFVYLTFFPSFLAMPRNVVTGTIAGAKGDIKTVMQKATSFLSMPLNTTGQILSNKNYWGRDIYNDDDTPQEKAMKIGSYLWKEANHPFVKAATNIIENKKERPLYQILSEALELPLRYRTKAEMENNIFYQEQEKKTTEKKQRTGIYKEVDDFIKSLEGKTKSEQLKMKLDIKLNNPQLYREVTSELKSQETKETKGERKEMGVINESVDAKVKYIKDNIGNYKTKREQMLWLTEMKNKGVYTATVKQIIPIDTLLSK